MPAHVPKVIKRQNIHVGYHRPAQAVMVASPDLPAWVIGPPRRLPISAEEAENPGDGRDPDEGRELLRG